MTAKIEKKNSSYRYDLSRPRSRHWQKDSKYKRCLNMMIPVCTKQHVSRLSSSVHEKVKQHWGCTENTSAYQKTCKLSLKMESS